jgi:transcriptional antiterminator RfaH
MNGIFARVECLSINEVTEKHWYLMQMKPNQHQRGLNNLLGRGYECYSPEIKVSKQRNGKRIEVVEPLFPGYVFIKLQRNCNWLSVSSTRGVAKFIRFGIYPSVVPEKTIASITQNLYKSAGYVVDRNEFKPGDRVIIDDECFKDFEAVFKCETSNNRCIILIKYIEKISEIIVKSENLRLLKVD